MAATKWALGVWRHRSSQGERKRGSPMMAIPPRASQAPRIPADDPELGGERLGLRVEHAAVHEEAMSEDERGTGATGVLEVEALMVEFGDGHAGRRYSRRNGRPERELESNRPP